MKNVYWMSLVWLAKTDGFENDVFDLIVKKNHQKNVDMLES